MGRIRVVIMDLDDTLWDWVHMWYVAFRAMFDRLLNDTGIPREDLIRDFKAVFQQHGTAEYAFVIEELPCLRQKYGHTGLAQRFKGAIRAFRRARASATKLYPSVLRTLERLKQKGVLLIGYTESRSFYTRRRLKKLGLDLLLDYVYTPADHELPVDLERRYRDQPEKYVLKETVHRLTPTGKAKPSPEVLLSIVHEVGARPDEVVYVGDKLHKDVRMAKDAGVHDVWAEYGEAKDRQEYALLREVTHWSTEEVEREKATSVRDVNPTHTLKFGFSGILEMFDFAAFKKAADKDFQHVLEAWKKAIDVQQHFNEIELKIRNLAITVLVAVMGAYALALREGLRSVAVMLLLLGGLGMLLFYMMDRLWYHRLLNGTVKHASEIEERHEDRLPELGLSRTISKASPLRILGIELHSTRKMDLFYVIIIVVLLAIAFLASQIVAPTSDRRDTPQTQPAVGSSASRPEGAAGTTRPLRPE